MEVWVAEIKLRAARRIGEISKGLEKGSGGDRKSNNFKMANDSQFEKIKKEALANAGLSQRSANRFEKIAEIPIAEFETVIAENGCPGSTRIRRKKETRGSLTFEE